MAIVNKMTTYDLVGKKLSFASWISNISPTETPFCSMTGKESISNTKFQWQTDVLPKIDAKNAVAEGSKPKETDILGTDVKENYAQIFRRGVSVSDTANTVSYYGRGKEVGYQMEKASLELKRDMERAFLWQNTATAPDSSSAVRRTSGFLGLVATKAATSDTDNDTAGSRSGFKTIADIKTYDQDADKANYIDPDTGAIIAHKTLTASWDENDIFAMTYNLYLANSKANVIMFHPKHAAVFAKFMDQTGGGATSPARVKMFGAMDDKFNEFVDTIVDPLGQRFALVPNRLMPEGFLYFFNPTDWTQMVLRAPKKVELAKQGSSQEWMIEAEIGLRHRNPYASGILKIGG